MKNNRAKIAAFVLGVILLAAGAAATVVSVGPHASAMQAINEFRDKAYVREDAEPEKDYTGRIVIVSGKISYDEGGASDPVFGVSADAAMIVRVAEMYQWLPSGDGFERGWSEELVDTDDASHANPTSYPSNVGSGVYSAHSVKVGGYRVTDDQLASLPSRQRIESPGDIDIRGYRTVGEYITNAENYDAPEIGDVRIRFEYVTVREMTLTGVQFEGAVESWRSSDRSEYGLSFEGRQTKAEVIAAYRRAADPVIWWLLVIGAVAAVGGAVLTVFGFRALSGYKPTLKLRIRKKKIELEGGRAAAVYSSALGIVTFAVALASAWARISAMWLLAALVLAVVFLYIFIPNVVKNTPKREKPETPYEPILRRRDEFKRK